MDNPWPPKRLKALRKAYGETQVEFAQRLSIHPGSYAFWEQGNVPSGMAQKLLERLEQDISERAK